MAKKRDRTQTICHPFLLQFMSAFLLLGIGITLSGFLLFCEHCYFRYIRKFLANFGHYSWCNLISTDVAESLESYAKAKGVGHAKITNMSDVSEAVLKSEEEEEFDETCVNPICHTQVKNI